MRSFSANVIFVILFHVTFYASAQWKNFVEVNVPEGKPGGYIVYDELPLPTGANGYSLFYAQKGDSLDKVGLFKVTPSGVVTTVQPLIYEKGKPNEYDLTIVKRPRKETNGGLATTVRVKVQDMNNFPPLFTFSLYNGTIKENSPANTIVMGLENCHAEERDTLGIKSYKIIKGNERGYLKTEKRDVGEKSFLQLKTTSKPIQRGNTAPYLTLIVEAEDMGNPPLTARTTIRVWIDEANDHAPVFDKNSYERAISEDTPKMMQVLKVQATDQDDGVSGEIYYFLQTLSSLFTINAFTGEITLVGELDYSQSAQRLHRLTVMARDGGSPSKETSASVIITVLKDIPNYPLQASPSDSQDNTAPFFPHAPYHFTIHISFPLKASLGVIFAVDEDPPDSNSELRYSLVSASREFSIDTFSGVLTVNNKLNAQTYTLTVKVQDQGNPSKQAQAHVKILVEDFDYSPNYPVFSDPIQVIKVAENVVVGTSVFQASVTSDSSAGKGVVYSAISGSGLPYFEVDETTGVMKTASPLDRETHAVYDMMIEARNKEKLPRHSHLFLTIDITNVDDAYPDFTKPAYDASVPEGSPKGTFVTVIHAIDKDDPVVSYGIPNSASEFEIQSNTGVIRTKRVLDRAAGDRKFLIYVTANDAGGKKSQAIVRINVTSTHNSVPKFQKESYEVSLKEGQGRVPNLLCIAATGSNGAVKYSMKQEGDKRFQVDQVTGTLSVKDSFDYVLDRAGFVVQVEAKSDSSSQKALAKVKVTIVNADEPPIFQKSSFEITTQENVAAGTKLLDGNTDGFRFSTDEKPVSDFDCTLEQITTEEILDHFRVQRVNSECQLEVIKNFISIFQREFKFQVRVTNTKQRNLFGSAAVTVKITDTNDYPPEFAQSSYWVTVATTTSTGSSLLQVVATDRDTQGSAGIVLELEGAREDLSRFQLDSEGVLRTVSSNLPGNTSPYRLKVKARETGTDQRKESEVSLKISVLSTPFVPVTFESNSYSRSLPEDALVGSPVFTVKASRSGSNKEIKYSIVGGNAENTFTINSDSGKVTLAKKMDYETIKLHKLIIRAILPSSDNKPDVTAEVTGDVVVTDVNDNKPRFLLYQSVTRIAIESYTPSATTIIQVTATDKDTVEKSGDVTYSIYEAVSSPSSNIPFSINRNTGELKTNREIKFADRSSYMLVIRATDGGGEESATTIQITVLDTSKPPSFNQNEYEMTISENSPVGTSVINIKADYDDPSVLLKYSFTEGNQDNMFCIDYMGVISVARPLDLESVSSYELSVMVSLNNNIDTAVVKVTISDVNEFAPAFEKPVYIIEVPENKAVNSNLRILIATDRDNGDNGRVTYSILQTVMDESKDLFAIDSTSGMVTLEKPLDREKIADHVLYIKAQDNGRPDLRLIDITKLIIKVTDVNDNTPRFSTTSYQVSIPANAKQGYQIIQTSATDLDSDLNSLVYFKIIEGNKDGVFTIDNTNGLIRLGKRSIASAAQDNFTLIVQASDEKDRSKKDITTVFVNVFPPNGPPQYPEPTLTFNIKEGLPAGNKMVSVAAATTEYVTYEILSGNEDGVIKIDPFSGDLVTALELDYETSPQYKLHIRARDNKGRTANVEVTINVQDINDNSPFFIDFVDGKVDRKVDAGIQEGDEVTQIEAYDLDGKSSMEYRLSSGGDAFLSIDNQGVIRAKRTLGDSIPGKKATEPLSTLYFNVEATDRTDPPNTVNTPVRLAFANYKSGQPTMAVRVPENARVGGTVAEIPRYIPGGKVSILYPETSPFSVDEEGRVRLTKELDFETQAKYVLTIREQGWTNSGPTANDIDLEISVVDVNDNDPRFEIATRHARINANSRAGTRAFQLRVSDADTGRNGLAAYQLKSADTPFGINPLDDTIEVAGELKRSLYDLQVSSFDYGIPRRKNAPSKIRLDVGQLPPRFVDFHDDGYKFVVSEDAKGGAVIGKIVAVSLSGSRIKYAILKGNSDNNFKITENGEIKLNFLMDYETQTKEHNLVVEAIELIPMGLSSTVEVKISVLNANDHYPRFEQGSYMATVQEDVPSGTPILTVSASDCDCSADCSCTSGQLVYSVVDTEFFTIDPDTGVLSNTRPLDFESQKTHIFQIEVSDTLQNDTKFDVAFVNITLSNADDNEPHFEFPENRLTIDEEAVVGRGLGAVIAHDSDHEALTYSITAGSGPFQIDSRTGIISLRESLPSGRWEYTLTVRAMDSDSYRDTTVIISIKDKNNNRPVFETCKDAKVMENLSPGQVVTQVMATDKDRGKNGEVEYNIVYGEEYFQIDNTTGIIKSRLEFDREKQSEYSVVIKAEDGGHGSSPYERLLRYCKMKVIIEDVNDNYPFFRERQYQGSVWKNANIGTSIIRVHAFDLDSKVNSKVEYRFTQANDKFEISNEGVISTKVSLKSVLGTFSYEVSASNTEPMTVGEKASDARNRKTEIKIFVTDLQPPMFTQPVFKGNITENSKPDTSIVQIVANSMNNKTLTYIPLWTWIGASEFFDIDPKTGIITSGAESFDHEKGEIFRMQFRARESNELFSMCLVEIEVKDLNDNSPTFAIESFVGRVPENAPTGTPVISVYADDADTGLAAEISYAIEPISGMDDDRLFTIDSVTGVIRTADTFDREVPEQQNFLLKVKASDKGNPPLSSQTFAKIQVVDDNDKEPIFEPTYYDVTVNENVPLGEVLLSFTVKNDDIGQNAIANFFISKGNQGQVFEVISKISSNHGELIVVDSLDYETTSEYTLTIVATDGRSASQPATVSIKVFDVNDNAPVFNQLRYQATVLEGSPSNQLVLTVSATDIDTTQEEIGYSLDQVGQRYFKIERTTGEIRTGKPLDREKTPVLNFTVLAHDGKHTGLAGIKIIVEDINDQPPYFPNPPYIGTVEENNPPGTSVIVVQAVDEDDPSTASNTKIKYTLDDDSEGRFAVDETTALISTTSSFDGEEEGNEYNITVRASDGGVPPLSATTVVTIKINDANDHRPQFNPNEYRASVPENAFPGFYVTTVKATDGDIGYNAALEFTIVAGNDPYAFYIDPTTGTILVSGELDFESKPSHILKINVSDQGIPQLTTSDLATVFITILDDNDHPPVFTPDRYSTSVLENVPIGTSLLTLTTTDKDTAIETKLFYEVILGDRADVFDVKPDPNDRYLGILYTTAALDRESMDIYNLEIIAKDEDGLFDTCFVTVTVLDVNDNGPHFVSPFYVGSILENVADPQFVVTITAYDPDEPSNGAPFSYKIINGTVNDNFVIRPNTAGIYSNGIFKYEEKQEWKIWVQATDSGNPTMSNVTPVYIQVTDSINNNEPFNASMTIVLNAYQGQFKGGEIGKVYYQDNDFGVDENEYKILNQNPGSYFSVDAKTGNLSASREIPIGYFRLVVQIKEKNRNVAPPKTAFSNVLVVVQNISQEAVRMSSTVQFVNIHKDAIFVGDFYSSFDKALSSIFETQTGDMIFPSGVSIFSIQTDPLNNMAINVQFSIRDMLSLTTFLSPTEIRTKLVKNKDAFQRIGLTVGAFGIDNCAQETNKTGVCQNTIKAGYAFTVISGDYGQFPAPTASLTFVSIDLELQAEYESIIKSVARTCADNPCFNDGICHDVRPKGFVCQCKHKYNGFITGPLCQETTRTFEGGLGTSYIWLQTLVAYERSVVQMEFTTTVADGLLLYQGPLVEAFAGESRDFMAIVLYGGFIRVVISLGAEPLILTMSRGVRLDDGEWHFVEVRKELKMVTLIIDHCKSARLIQLGDEMVEHESDCKITGKIRGDNYYLNNLWPLQIGGVENPGISYPNLNYTGFNGCIRRVTNNKHMYDLKTPLKVVNSREGCQKADSCPSCNYHGYCEPSLTKKSVCVCDVGFSGSNCLTAAVGNYYLESSYSQYSVTSWNMSHTITPLKSTLSRQRRQATPAPRPITSEYFTNIALKMKAKPGTNDSLIFLSTNSLGTEFVRVDLQNGVIRCIFRLAGRTKILKLPAVNVTDGKYHTVIVERLGNYATFQVDYAGKVEGSTGGNTHLINYGGGALFTGGLRRLTALRVMQAIVKSHGKAIVQTASGSLISTYSAFSGSSLSGVSLITINSQGDVHVKTIKNATLIKMYQKHTVRSVFNSSSQRVVIGSAGVSVTDVRASNNSLQSVQQILQRRHQQNAGATSSGGNLGFSAGTAAVVGGKVKGVGSYGSGFVLRQAGGGQTKTHEVVDESYGGCIPQNRVNNIELDDKYSTHVQVERQNVVFGCPCETGECANNGTCTAKNISTPLTNTTTTPWKSCQCVGNWTGPRCQEEYEDDEGFAPPVIPPDGPSWYWKAVLAFLLLLLIFLFLLGFYLLCKRCKSDAVDGTALVTAKEAAPTGHGTVRSYSDVGAGEEDSNDYDLRHLMKYMYHVRDHGVMDLDHGHEHASIRNYKDGVQGTDNNQFDLKTLMSYKHHVIVSKNLGASNHGFHGSTPAVHSNLQTMIAHRVKRADSHTSLSHDELHSFEDEGLDSDVDGLSQLDSGDEKDWDNPDDWDNHFVSLGRGT